MGAQAARKLGIEGEEGPGVIAGIDYLEQRKRGMVTDLGREVVVIGGGNTAIDAARSARRDGARVTLLYRRSLQEMPAASHEIEDAVAEGVRLMLLCAPRKILRDGITLKGIEFQRMRLGEPDENGRRQPIPIPGDLQTLQVDCVIVAVSQEPGWQGITQGCNNGKWLHTKDDGKLDDDLWAGGDDRGPGIASRAIAQGRLAAESAHAELCGEPVPSHWRVRPALRPGSVKQDYYPEQSRGGKARRPANEWLSQPDLEIDQTISSEQASHEAARCMSCGSCFGCQQCFMYCNAAGFTHVEEVAPGHYFAQALEACEGCGKCIELCPCGYMEAQDKAIW
jgi:NADPH-dependent glutamate synthase beta subunit-like oxidoreductase